jgi:hypothetical protein
MRLAGCTWKSIAKVTKYSERHARQIHADAVARAFGEMDLEDHRKRIFMRLEMALEALEPWVTGQVAFMTPEELAELPTPPNMEHFNAFLTLIQAEMRLLGANAPKRTEDAHSLG